MSKITDSNLKHSLNALQPHSKFLRFTPLYTLLKFPPSTITSSHPLPSHTPFFFASPASHRAARKSPRPWKGCSAAAARYNDPLHIRSFALAHLATLTSSGSTATFPAPSVSPGFLILLLLHAHVYTYYMWVGRCIRCKNNGQRRRGSSVYTREREEEE